MLSTAAENAEQNKAQYERGGSLILLKLLCSYGGKGRKETTQTVRQLEYSDDLNTGLAHKYVTDFKESRG